MEQSLVCLENDRVRVGETRYLDDDRPLRFLRCLDDKHLPSQNYLDFQKDLRPYMRRTVANWMIDVCDEQESHEEVLVTAINYLDRILTHIVPVKRCQLQLLATVAMFIASKFRDTNPISATHLVMYTDYSITVDELLNWEVIVLQALKWDLSCVSPYNFLDQFLPRLPEDVTAEQRLRLRRHSAVLIVMCSVEPKFAACPPSLVSAAALSAAAYGLLGSAWCLRHRLHRLLGKLASVDQVGILINTYMICRVVLDLA